MIWSEAKRRKGSACIGYHDDSSVKVCRSNSGQDKGKIHAHPSMPLHYPLPGQSNPGKIETLMNLPQSMGRIFSKVYLSLRRQGGSGLHQIAYP